MSINAIAGTNEIIHEFVRALGIEIPEVRRVVLDISSDDVVVTVTERCVTWDQMKAATEVMKRYKLTIMPEESQE